MKIEEECESVLELRHRVDLLERQQQVLTKALLADSLGLEISSKKHENFRRAVKHDRPVRIQLTFDEGLVRLDYVVEIGTLPILRVESVHSIRGRGTVYDCEYLRRDVPVHMHDKLRCADALWELVGVESGMRDTLGLMLRPVDHRRTLEAGCELSLA